MSNKLNVGPGIVRKGEVFCANKNCFSVAETVSGYTLYASVGCKSQEDGNKAWKEANGIPDGWKACSDPIPANTQHNVFDVVPSTYFFLYGLTDEKVAVRNL